MSKGKLLLNSINFPGILLLELTLKLGEMWVFWEYSCLIYLKTENEIRKNNLSYTFMQQNLSIVEGHKVKVNSSLVISLQWDEASPSMQMWAADITKSIIYVWKIMKYYIAWFLTLQFISLLFIVKNYEETMKKTCWSRGWSVKVL